MHLVISTRQTTRSEKAGRRSSNVNNSNLTSSPSIKSSRKNAWSSRSCFPPTAKQTWQPRLQCFLQLFSPQSSTMSKDDAQFCGPCSANKHPTTHLLSSRSSCPWNSSIREKLALLLSWDDPDGTLLTLIVDGRPRKYSSAPTKQRSMNESNMRHSSQLLKPSPNKYGANASATPRPPKKKIHKITWR